MSEEERFLRYRRMSRELAKHIPKPEETSDQWQRAAGDTPCDLCGLAYYDHPNLENGLVVTCDGRWWKL